MALLLLILILTAVAGTLRVALRDDRPRLLPPLSHHIDADLLPPSERLSH